MLRLQSALPMFASRSNPLAEIRLERVESSCVKARCRITHKGTDNPTVPGLRFAPGLGHWPLASEILGTPPAAPMWIEISERLTDVGPISSIMMRKPESLPAAGRTKRQKETLCLVLGPLKRLQRRYS